MTRSIFFFVICIFFLLFVPKTYTEKSVFLINEEPTVLHKGYYNNAFIIAMSFQHEQLLSFLQENEKSPITLLITTDLLQRSPELVLALQSSKHPIGLLGSTSSSYAENNDLLLKELDTFEELLHFKPVYFMTEDLEFPSALLKQLHQNEINAIAPTIVTSLPETLNKGQLYLSLIHI